MSWGILGSADAYFQETLDGRVTYGARTWVGNCTSFKPALKNTTIVRESFGRDNPGVALSTVGDPKPTAIDFELDDLFRPEAAVLAHHAETEAINQASATATTITGLVMVLDAYVEIDAGVTQVSTVTITGKVEGVDFVVNAERGWIKALNSGTAGAQNVTYNNAAVTGTKFFANRKTQIQGILEIDGRNRDGNKLFYFVAPDAIVVSTAAVDMVAKAFQKATFTGYLNALPGEDPYTITYYD